MAPRRGGGGGGSSGGSSISDTPWGQYVTLNGSHFTRPLPVATIVFTAIGCLGLVGIIFFALTIKNKTLDERNRKLFKGYAFWLTIILISV